MGNATRSWVSSGRGAVGAVGRCRREEVVGRGSRTGIAPRPLPAVDAEALRGLKFSATLPGDLAINTLAHRMIDGEGEKICVRRISRQVERKLLYRLQENVYIVVSAPQSLEAAYCGY